METSLIQRGVQIETSEKEWWEYTAMEAIKYSVETPSSTIKHHNANAEVASMLISINATATSVFDSGMMHSQVSNLHTGCEKSLKTSRRSIKEGGRTCWGHN